MMTKTLIVFVYPHLLPSAEGLSDGGFICNELISVCIFDLLYRQDQSIAEILKKNNWIKY